MKHKIIFTLLIVAVSISTLLWQAAQPTSAQENQPYLVKKINGAYGSPSELIALGDKILFRGNDGIHGFELWVSDGTPDGTFMLKDIYPGSFSYPFSFVALGDIVMFIASDEAHGEGLWRTDGTSDGTYLVKDINPDDYRSFEDGVKLIRSGSNIFFPASDGVHGIELWQSDGTLEGTHLVKDINSGGEYSNSGASNHIDVNGILYFKANDGLDGDELWRTDGTSDGTYLVSDIFPGEGGSGPRKLHATPNGLIYFLATNDGSRKEVWRSDGTDAGTYQVADLLDDIGYIITNGTFGNQFIFQTYINNEITTYITDGTPSETTEIANNISAGHFTDANGFAFFPAYSDETGSGLWRTGGTRESTYLIKNFYPGQNTLWSWDDILVDNVLYFAAEDPVHGIELWRSDGTEDSTHMIMDIVPGNADSRPVSFIIVDRKMLFQVFESDGVGQELWALDLPPVSSNCEVLALAGSSFEGSAIEVPSDHLSVTKLHHGRILFNLARWVQIENSDASCYEIHGTDGPDYIIGSAVDDTIYTYRGMDRIRGEDGNDTFYPGLGSDRIHGGAGYDTIINVEAYDICNYVENGCTP